MAGTGYDWGSFAFATNADAAGNWDAVDLTTGGNDTSAAISLDTLAACEVGVTAYIASGTVTGVVYVYLFGDADGTNYEAPNRASFAFTFTPVEADTVYKRFAVLPKHFGSFKINIANASGATVALSVKYRTATIPVAS